MAARGPLAEFATEAFRLAMPGHPVPAAPAPAELVIRPEDIRIGRNDGAGGVSGGVSGGVTLGGTVAASTYSGDRALYSIALAAGRTLLTYGSARDGALEPGVAVTLAFDAGDCILLT